jgi:peptidyl-prolyl cis-trans isomerase D
MLQFLRGHASSWVIKILLGLIILSFGIWGISGLFVGRGQQVLVAKVGQVEISKQYFLHEVQKRLQAANRDMKDANLTLEQAIKMGLTNKILDDMVRQYLIAEELQSLKLAASTNILSAITLQDPAFKNDQGRFDGGKFKSFLAQRGMTEAQYMAHRARTLMEAQLLSAVSAASKPAGALSLRMFNDLFQERDITLYTINEDVVEKNTPNLSKISKDELVAYYDSHKDAYKTQEKRTFSFVLIDPKALEGHYTFSDAEIKDAYETQMDNYVVPEKRDLQVYMDKDWRKVKLVSKLLEEGKPLPKNTVTTLYNIGQEELGDKLGTEAFDLKVKETSDVFKNEDGEFQVVKVLKITPSKTKPLERVRTEIIADLKRQKALDEASTLTQTIEDAISGGASLEEIAKAHHLPFTKDVEISKKSGEKPLKKHPLYVPSMAKAVFEQEAGEVGPTIELEDGRSYIVQVNHVEPQHIDPLEKVTPLVRTHLITQRLKDATQKKVEAALDGNKLKGSLEKDPCFKVRRFPKMIFADMKEHADITPEIRTILWALEKGESAIVIYKDEPAIGTVTGIKAASAEKNLGDYASLKMEIAELLTRDLLLQYFNALKEKHNVTIYEDILDNLTDA